MRITLLGKDLYHAQTEYGDIHVCNSLVDRKDKAIVLLVDRSLQSAVYSDPARKDELVFDYMQSYAYAFQVNPHIRNTFMIGGGGFTYAQHYVKNHPSASITVAEICKEVIFAAVKYFGLKDLTDDCKERLQIVYQEGISWLLQNKEKFDFIVNDAFIATDGKARDGESVKVIHEHLNEGGIYVVNVLASVAGENTKNADETRKTLGKYFKYIASMAPDEEAEAEEVQNILIFASDSELL